MKSIEKQNITAIILAGGKSSRMGQEKGLVLHNGSPFILHIITAITPITDKIVISTANEEYRQFGYPCIKDSIADCGPIGGIYTGLHHSTTEKNLILSCDIPFITVELLQNLVHKHQTGFDATYYYNMPLIGIYNKSVSEIVQNSIRKKRLKVLQLLSKLKTQYLPVDKDIESYLSNINTPEQYNQTIQWN